MDTRPNSNPASQLAFHASRIVIDVGVLLVLGAMSVPFVTTAGGSRSAMELDALPTLLLLAPIFAVTLLPDHTRPLPRPVAFAALLLGLLAFPYSLLKYLDATVLARTLGGSLGLGSRMLVFGCFVVLVGIAIGLTRAWMGLASAGSPTRTSAAPRRIAPRLRRSRSAESPTQTTPAPTPSPRPAARRPGSAPPPQQTRPARSATEVNPFGEPLFDSLEIPASSEGNPPRRQPGLVFGGSHAAERVADALPEDPDAEHEAR